MKTCCHMSCVHEALDVRIYHKECVTLAKAGYDVSLVARHSGDRDLDGVHIRALPAVKNRLRRIFFLVPKALALARDCKARVYQFHDPELLPAGLLLKWSGKRVIYDVHEDVPAQILNKEWLGPVWFRRLAACLFNFLEQGAALCLDGIIAATSEIENKFKKLNGHKTVLVRNYPLMRMIGGVQPSRFKKTKKALIYAGGLDGRRGIREMIRACELLDPEAELWLLGEWESEAFQKECMALAGWRLARYFGRKEPEAVYALMKEADVGLCLLSPAKNYLRSLPVKAFEYMACGLPIVMSDFPYWREIYGTCALFADPGVPRDIADKIRDLFASPALCDRMGRAGMELTGHEYSWEREGLKYLRFVESLRGGPS